jgi:hypothetical protein
VPEASVIRGLRALSGIIGRKEMRRRPCKSFVKAQSLTLERQKILLGLRQRGENRIPSGAVKCIDIGRNTSGESDFLALA